MGFRVINVDNASATGSPALTATVIKTWNLDVTDDEYIAVLATIGISTTGTSKAQVINLVVTCGSQTFSFPWTTAAAVVANGSVSLTAAFVSRAGDTITVGIGAAGQADPQTVVTAYNFYIQAWSGTRPGT